MSSVTSLIYFMISFLGASIFLYFNKEELQRTKVEELNESTASPLNVQKQSEDLGLCERLCFKF